MTKKDYSHLSQEILKNVGGSANITSVTHCMTRLRFNLKDESLPDAAKLKQLDEVVGVANSGGQYQVVIGPAVADVYDALIKQLDDGQAQGTVANDDATKNDIAADHSNQGIINRIFDYLAGSLTPLIPILLTASLFKTIAAIIGPTALKLVTEKSDLYTVLAMVGDAGFYFLPVFVAYYAAKKLQVSSPIAMLLGAILIHPTLIKLAAKSAHFTVFGLPTTAMSYASTVLPILLTVWIMSYIERFLRRYVPSVLQVFLVPFGTVFVMVPVSLVVLAPLGGYLGQYLSDGIIALSKVAGPLAVALIGALFTFMVLSGMHIVLLSFLFVSFPTTGFDSIILPGILAASWAGTGVALACWYKFKSRKNKELTLGYILTWFFGGVGEPLLYGLSVPYKTPLVAGAIAGGITGLVAGIFKLTAYVLNTSNGIYGLAAFVGGSTWNYIALGLTVIIALVSGFVTMSFLKLDE
mgnify:CR=1 FL=1